MSKRIGEVSAPCADVGKGTEREQVEEPRASEVPNVALVYASRAGVEFCLELDEVMLLPPGKARDLSWLLDAGAREAERMARGDGETLHQLLSRRGEEARAALRVLGGRLVALSEASCGELAAEARRALMLACMPLGAPAEVERALELAAGLASFVDNWSDCARRGRKTLAEESDRLAEAARCCRALSNSEASDALLGAARALDARSQALAEKEEPERERRDREFDEGVLDPAKDAAGKAVEALVAFADAWLAAKDALDV